jgi:hypothetical protein
MNAQLIKLLDGKFVVLRRGKMNKGVNTFYFDEFVKKFKYSGGAEYEGEQLIFIADEISNIDKVFEMWKEATDEKEADNKSLEKYPLDKYVYADVGMICMISGILRNEYRDDFLTARKDYYSLEDCIGFGEFVENNNRDYDCTANGKDKVCNCFRENDCVYRKYKETKELFHLYQLSLIPDSLEIEWDENKNLILKVIL